jgi:peptidoglycan/LPS O-acetylase OafA/YrhL
MLGTLRFVLALLVVMNHLWLPTANKVGAHAVIGFYVVSGFLMTSILCETYIGPGGRVRYFANRFLRLFPGYWFVVLLSLAGLVAYPGYFGNVHSAIRIPQTGYEWLQNATLFDLIYAPLRLVPPAWSLSVEWVFYILIGVGISSRAGWTIAWWLASGTYTIFLIMTGATFGDRYTPPVAASLFFSTGAVIYHWVKSQPVGQRGGAGHGEPSWRYFASFHWLSKLMVKTLA